MTKTTKRRRIYLRKYYADQTCMNLIRTITFIVLLLLSWASWYYLRPFPMIMWILLAIFLIVYVIMGMIWLPLWFKRLTFCLSPQELVYNCGLIICSRRIMKVDAIQFVTLVTTPFSKHTGLNFILISALGGSLLLPFLSYADAKTVYSFLYGIIFQNTQDSLFSGKQ